MPSSVSVIHAPVHDHPDTIAGTEDSVQIVRDHDDGELQFLLQVQHQVIEGRRADRVEPRGGLIEEQQLGVQRQGARQRRALDHAAGELRRVLAGRLGRQADQADLEEREVIQRARVEAEVLEHRQLHVLPDGEAGVEGAGLETDAVAGLDAAQLGLVRRVMSLPLMRTVPACGALQSQDRAQQHRLAGAGAADDAEHLVGVHLHVEAVVHHLGAEAVDEPLHLRPPRYIRRPSP